MDTMRTAASGGGAGDIILGIPVLKILGVQKIYIKENFYPEGEGSLYANLKPLLEVNDFEVLPTSGQYPLWTYEPGLRYDHNLDHFRDMPDRNRIHIQINMHRAFGLPDPSSLKPWLKVDSVPSGLTSDVTLINVTNRWRDGSLVRWSRIIESIKGEKYFIGLKIDHERFEKEIGGTIKHFITKDFLEVARAIRDCQALYCNQGICLAVAQGIGKDYWLEKKPIKTNVLTRLPNEHILNPDQ